MPNEFHDFEHEGWERVAHKYEKTWSRLTKTFIPALLTTVKIRNGVRVLDVACGPGYVARAALAAGAVPLGFRFLCGDGSARSTTESFYRVSRG
jgi:2-polyprenyl-3-methyl-5-hydroxy-6-metoxy-1,4-benzoquinol methylase